MNLKGGENKSSTCEADFVYKVYKSGASQQGLSNLKNIYRMYWHDLTLQQYEQK